jgi:hypothetical protein
MRQKKQPPKKLVAVRIPPDLDRDIEKLCKRDGVMKMDVFILALRNHLEAAYNAV